jgi:hypothetical protein
MYKSDNFDESSLNKDINEHIYGGGNVSHILNVIINQSTTDDIKYNIRKQVFDKINNVPIMFTIQNTQVVITWRSKAISNHYHADVMGIYGDTAVKLHTEMLLKIFDMSDCLGGSKLSFMVTKPLVRIIPLLPSEVKLTSNNK